MLSKSFLSRLGLLLTTSVLITALVVLTLPNGSQSEFQFKVDDVFSYEFASISAFSGNLTAVFPEAYNDSGLSPVNCTVERWTIEQITAISIRVTNITDDLLTVEVKRHFTYNGFEEFRFTNNDTLERETTKFDFLAKDNLTICKADYLVVETTNADYYPPNQTNFFWNKPNPSEGESLNIDSTEFVVANYSKISTFEGERNVTNLLSPAQTSQEFIYSYILAGSVYLGEFSNRTMLSMGRTDGLLVAGTTLFAYHNNTAYSHPFNGEISIKKTIDIVSSSVIDPGREMGSIYWIVGGIATELFFIYIFESKALMKAKKNLGEQRIKRKAEKDHITIEDEIQKQTLEIHMPNIDQK